MKEMNFVGAYKDFFGMKPGQTSIDFLKEIKELTLQDREDIANSLEQNGYKILGQKGKDAAGQNIVTSAETRAQAAM